MCNNMTNFNTKENELYINNQKVIGVWESFNGWYRFATEELETGIFDLGDKEVKGTTYYGLVQGQEEEWGNFCTTEFEELIKQKKMWKVSKKNWTFSGRR